jgi:hypothetical protein
MKIQPFARLAVDGERLPTLGGIRAFTIALRLLAHQRGRRAMMST